jgi:tetratricopeptide (TPR) repeat protein
MTMNISETIDLVIRYYQSGDFRQAENTCKNLLKEHPNDADALHCLGLIYFQAGQHDQAIDYIKRVVQIDPSFADAYNNLGNIYQEVKQIDDAIASYEKALTLNPNSAKTYYNLGLCLQDQGLPDKAIDCYQKALRFNLHTFGLFNNLGFALQQTGHFDEALFYLRKALEMNPNDAGALNNMGIILQEKGRYDEAVNCYLKALQFQPSFAKAYYNMGLALQGKGNLEEAKAYLQKSIHLAPKDPSAYQALSQVFHLEGQRFALEKSSFSPERTVNTISVQVDNKNKLLYVVIPKAGSTTVKHTLFFHPLFGNCDYPEILKEINHIIGWNYTTTLEPHKEYFKFTVVRDPYTRFMSAFFHLIHKDYRYRNNFHVIQSLGMEDWPDEIVTDPNKFLHHVDKGILNRDPHTALQSSILPKDLNELDYIGQLESMKETEETLSRILSIRVKFGHMMLGSKAPKIDYYSIRIDKKRFNQIFAEDYEILKDFYSPLKK